jgi:opacity protein-like surface antigen
MKCLAINLFFAGATLMGASGALAQTPPAAPPSAEQPAAPPAVERRPYRGLFAGGEAQARREGLSLRLSAAGGYDDNAIAGQAGSTGPENPVASSYGTGDASLSYWVARERASFGVVGSTQLRIYENAAVPRTPTHSAVISGTLPVGRQWTLNANQIIRYSPYYQLGGLPVLPPRASGDGFDIAAPTVIDADAPNLDRGLTALTTYRYGTALDLTQDISEASVMRYSAGYARTDFADGRADSYGARAGVQFARRMTRYATLRLGYAYQETHSGLVARRTVMHNLGLGGGYSRPLSFSRRTTVSFSGGTAVVDGAGGQRYRLIGDAAVHREIGRTWLARFAYNQGVQFVEVLPDPLYGSAFRASADGLLSRRADLSLDAGYSTGGLSVGGAGGADYTTTSASARFRFAVTRSLAWYAEYAYSQYVFSEAISLPQGFSNEVARHSVRTGITLWIPLFTPRRANAAR